MSYDDWKSGYYDAQPDYCCDECEKKDYKLDNAKDFLTGIMDQLYGKEKFDLALLEFRLDELCHYLDVEPMPGDLQIEPKEDNKVMPIEKWLQFNELEQVTQQEIK